MLQASAASDTTAFSPHQEFLGFVYFLFFHTVLILIKKELILARDFKDYNHI